MRLVIRTFWNKVVLDTASPFGTKVLTGEYVPKPNGYVSYPNETRSVTEFQEQAKERHDFMQLIPNGARFNGGKWYGIHSYNDVTIEEGSR